MLQARNVASASTGEVACVVTSNHAPQADKHHSVCCSDQAAAGFGRVGGLDPSCPFVQTTVDEHATEAMCLETAERGWCVPY